MKLTHLYFAGALVCASTAHAQSPPQSAPLPPLVAPTQPEPDNKPNFSQPAAAAVTPAAEQKNENLTPLHPQQVDLQWKDDHWLLMDDGVTIKDFGRRENEARVALRLIRDLGLTQHATIGSPMPVMEYWLVDGHAPTRVARGLRTKPIDLESLKVEQSQKQWVIRDVYQILFNFGSHEQDARQAAEVIRRYRFTQLGVLGQGNPAMLVFLGEKDHVEQPTLHTPRMTSQVHAMTPEKMTAGPPNTGSEGSVQPATNEPTLPRTSPLHPKDTPKADADKSKSPDITMLPQGRQLSPPTRLVPDLEAAIDSVPFDYRQVKAKKEGKDWQLKMGNYIFAHFGNDEEAAKKALDALQFYHCNQQCLVGGSQPVFTYYLANGQAPRGSMLGVNTTAFRPDDLKVKQDKSAWTVTDGYRVIFTFEKEATAKDVLQAVQKHRFDHVFRFGHGEVTSMTLLVKCY
jgi:hypothetical protein